MFKMLIDTCVWLDLAKDPRQVPVLGAIEEMVKLGMVTLIVPRVVLDEFRRNRERIAKESAKSLSAHFRLVKDAVDKIGGDKRRMRVVLSHLDDVDHKIPIVGGAAADALDRIEKLLTAPPIIELSAAVKLRAAQRAIERRPRSIATRARWPTPSLSRRTPNAYATRQRQGFASHLSRTTGATSASSTATTKYRTQTCQPLLAHQVALLHQPARGTPPC